MQIYRIYDDYNFWNVRPDDDDDISFLPVYSVTNTRLEVHDEDVIAILTGTFSFSGSPQTISEVSGTVSEIAVYSSGNQELLEYRAFSPNFDFANIKVYNFQAELDALAGDDTFQGSPYGLNDALQTLAGNDIFIGLGDEEGDFGDVWFAGSGIDTSVYRGNLGEYAINNNALIYDLRVNDGSQVPGMTVRDSVAGRDGYDQLNDVERLQFNDFNLAYDINGHAGQAYRLYQAAFDRTPDAGGLGYWIAQRDANVSMQDIAYSFVVSEEFRAQYGPDSSNETFINALYMNVLNREADAGGYDYWLGLMNDGLSRQDMLAEFSESPENQANVFDAIANGIVYVALLTFS